ncbi:MAG: hypothetical protein OES13_11255 [Acidimicrobiia bacterium]|nr:hypothetical protein [Acidimicrobiia bacterium]
METLIAVAIGVTIMALGYWVVHLLATPTPAEPDLDAVEPVDQNYGCTVCGLQLVVTFAQRGDVAAPKHCREEMVPV